MIPVAVILLITWEVSPLMIIDTLEFRNISFSHYGKTDREISRYVFNGKTSSKRDPSLNIKNWENKFDPYFNTSATILSSYIACPPKTKLIQGKCYDTVIFERFLNITHWSITTAQTYCKEANGQLAGKPLERWGNWTTSLQLKDDTYYFVNISKIKHDWFWPNGDPVVEWDNGQPSGAGGSNACATLWSVSDKLFEIPCTSEHGNISVKGIICEFPKRGICDDNRCECFKGYYGKSCQYECSTDCLLPYVCSSVGNISLCKCHEAYREENNECISSIICPDNFTQILGYCYQCKEENKTWQDAQTSCQHIPGGALAEPPLPLWDHWLYELPIEDFQTYWVNLQKTQDGWYWPSGKNVQHWDSNQPDGGATEDACAALYSLSFNLSEKFCSNTTYFFICEAPKSGCIPGYFGRNCNYGFTLYIWLSIASLIIILPLIALLFYMRMQHLKYKEEIEYKMRNKPRGHSIIMYTREDDIYISQVDFTPLDPQNLQLHEGQIIEVISSTTHNEILYGKPYGIENAKEGYFSKQHVKQSQYGLADADLCSDLWSDLDFTVHKMEVKNVEDFKSKLLNCREEISADSRTQNCFSFTFIGHGYTEDKTEFIELKGYNDEDDKYSRDNFYKLKDTSVENSFFNNGFCNVDESQCQIGKNENQCIVNSDFSDNIEKGELSTHLEQVDIDVRSNEENENMDSVGFPVRLIYEMFTPKQCPRLTGVPKLFYIQACRGDKIDTPEHIVDENYRMCTYETAGRAFITNTIFDNQMNPTSDSLASYSDLYVFCSSFTGYFSYFSRREGKSLFIKELCDVYRRDHTKHTLSEMNTKVKDKISKMNISIGVNDEKQIPTVSVDTLRKILKFK